MARSLKLERKLNSMHKYIYWATCIVCTLVLSTGSCQSDKRQEGWRGDLDHYIAAVKRDHYVYRSKELPATFKKLSDDLRKNIPNYTDQRMLLEFERLAAQLGDGHTYILPWAAEQVAAQSLPVRFYLFADGLFIIDAQAPYRDLIGSRVNALGNVKATDAMTRIGEYISCDNEVGIPWIGPVFLMLRSAWEMLGETSELAKLGVTDSQGRTKEVLLPFGPVPRMRGIPKLVPSQISSKPAPLYLSRVETNYWMTPIAAPESTWYVQFNQVMNDPAESLASFARRLGDSLRRVTPMHLVIDVRHNNGGNAMLLDPLLMELKQYKDRPSTRITIITGRNTFSACQIFISRADALLHPVFAGERSSSKPNFVGEEHEVMLPYSGARGSISNRYHESIPGDTRNWIEIDLPVQLYSSEYFTNQDPVMDKVIGLK